MYLHTYTHTHIPLITLQSVWVEYVVSCKEAGVHAAQYSTLRHCGGSYHHRFK